MDKIKFLVDNKLFEIELEKIQNYQNKNNFLNLITKHHLEKTIGVEEKNDAIVIHRDNKYFSYIIAILNNPQINWLDLFEYNFNGIDLENRLKFKDFYGSSLMFENEFTKFNEDLFFYGISIENWKTNCKLDKNNKNMIKKIDKRLDELNLKSPLFIEKIKILDACLSGSFILQCILDEYWESDIDIYINLQRIELILGNDKKLLEKNLISFFYCYDFSDYNLIELNEEWLSKSYGRCKDLVYLLKFKLNNINIDFVIVSCTVRYFIEGFDFDFNKIYYDGYVVHAFDWKSIKNRISYNNCDGDRYNSSSQSQYLTNYKRINKYLLRGFVLLIKNNIDDIFYEMSSIDTVF